MYLKNDHPPKRSASHLLLPVTCLHHYTWLSSVRQLQWSNTSSPNIIRSTWLQRIESETLLSISPPHRVVTMSSIYFFNNPISTTLCSIMMENKYRAPIHMTNILGI